MTLKARQHVSKNEDEGEFAEVRGLQAEEAEVNPAPGTVHGHTDAGNAGSDHGEHRGTKNPPTVLAEALEVDAEGEPTGQEREGHVHQLAIKRRRPIFRTQRNARTVLIDEAKTNQPHRNHRDPKGMTPEKTGALLFGRDDHGGRAELTEADYLVGAGAGAPASTAGAGAGSDVKRMIFSGSNAGPAGAAGAAGAVDGAFGAAFLAAPGAGIFSFWPSRMIEFREMPLPAARSSMLTFSRVAMRDKVSPLSTVCVPPTPAGVTGVSLVGLGVDNVATGRGARPVPPGDVSEVAGVPVRAPAENAVRSGSFS